MLYTYNGISPQVDPSAFIAPSAEIIGNVKLGKISSVWFQTLIRGDVNFIEIGDFVNIQDQSLIHVSREKFPTIIGNNITIGHRAILHGCILKDHSFVGIGATVLDGAEIGEHSFVGAGSLVTPGKKFPSGVLILGTPAKIIRDITEADLELMEKTWKNYSDYGQNYKINLQNP